MARARGSGQLRIIGGRFRSRRLPVPDAPGLRPTTDRIRETLFNWLAPRIEAARCLDCFAGAGGLGFEAASRGAVEVVMLERSARVCRQLRANAEALGAGAAQIIEADALRWLDAAPALPFELVFLDPPFASGLLAPACEHLARNGWVAAGGLVYLEWSHHEGRAELPADWSLVRERRAGDVGFALAEVPG